MNASTKYDSNHKTHSLNERPDHAVTLEGNNFNKFIKKYPLSIVDFWAPWYTSCRAITPRLRRVLNIYKGKLAVGKLDIQKNQDIAKQYKITGIPNLIFFRFGKKIASIIGVRSIGYIKNVIEDLLAKRKK